MAAAPEPLRLFAVVPEQRDKHSHPETAVPVFSEVSLHTVSEAGRLVARAQAHFVAAVITARSAGCSWRLIGTAAGVPYQSLHRRFGQHPKPTGASQDGRAG